MLRCAGNALRPGGTLILELPHPRETFRLDDVTTDGWDVPEGDDNALGIGLKGEGGGILEVTWGDDEDEFDPITQVRSVSVSLRLERQGVISQEVSEKVPQREFTLGEILALAKLSGHFTHAGGTGHSSGLAVALYGSMELVAAGNNAGVRDGSDDDGDDDDDDRDTGSERGGGQQKWNMVAVDDEEEAYRMVVVLTKTPASQS
mmetsp:Transcript_82097/g.160199  ORF Transcript_82097/g.160199 Transcript_82097/m.160199 type:complete len:204 (-) Transcript_82097:235-846(-)